MKSPNKCFFLFVWAIVGASAPAQNWTQFGGPSHTFQTDESFELPSSTPTKRWQQRLGAGMSGIVEHDGVIVTSYLMPFDGDDVDKPEHERVHREAIVAMDADNGRFIWKHVYEAGWIESQQAFGGRSRAPQATPAIIGDRIVSIGFTGIVHCLDLKSGKVVWKKDAVRDLGAIPVQFGFSSSPVPMDDKVLLLVGGELGLVCVDVHHGEKVWNVPCKEASYATPVVWNRADGRQVVFVTRNRVVGVEANTGKQVWDYQLPGKGLTNVPTPIVIDDTGIVISGQGIKGTRRIDIQQNGDNYRVRETWQTKVQFFYCNWVRKNDCLVGCDGKLLLAIDVRTGKTVGRFRGYNDGNMLLFREEALVLDGEGRLSTFRVSDRGLEAVAKYAVLNERCWTPPTPVGDLLFCRGGDQLLCVKVNGGDPRAAVVSLPVRKPRLAFHSGVARDDGPDAMEQIVSAYESNGTEAAWKLYSRIRDNDPDAISFQKRRQLIELAKAEGLQDFVKRIERHAAEDFPKEFAEASRKASSEVSRGENGLLYVEFALRNTGLRTIQAEVKGPSKHPFGYGLPIRPNSPRIEKWPVGTKLYRTLLGVLARRFC